MLRRRQQTDDRMLRNAYRQCIPPTTKIEIVKYTPVNIPHMSAPYDTVYDPQPGIQVPQDVSLQCETRARHYADSVLAKPITSVEIPKAVGEVSFYCTNAGPANCIHCAAREQNAKKTPIDDRDHK